MRLGGREVTPRDDDRFRFFDKGGEEMTGKATVGSKEEESVSVSESLLNSGREAAGDGGPEKSGSEDTSESTSTILKEISVISTFKVRKLHLFRLQCWRRSSNSESDENSLKECFRLSVFALSRKCGSGDCSGDGYASAALARRLACKRSEDTRPVGAFVPVAKSSGNSSREGRSRGYRVSALILIAIKSASQPLWVGKFEVVL